MRKEIEDGLAFWWFPFFFMPVIPLRMYLSITAAPVGLLGKEVGAKKYNESSRRLSWIQRLFLGGGPSYLSPTFSPAAARRRHPDNRYTPSGDRRPAIQKTKRELRSHLGSLLGTWHGATACWTISKRARLSTELGPKPCYFSLVGVSSSTRQHSLPPKTKEANYFHKGIHTAPGFKSSINDFYTAHHFSAFLRSLPVDLNDTVAQRCQRERGGEIAWRGDKDRKYSEPNVFTDGVLAPCSGQEQNDFCVWQVTILLTSKHRTESPHY